MEENDKIWGTKVVLDAGDSTNFQPGQMVNHVEDRVASAVAAQDGDGHR